MNTRIEAVLAVLSTAIAAAAVTIGVVAGWTTPTGVGAAALCGFSTACTLWAAAVLRKARRLRRQLDAGNAELWKTIHGDDRPTPEETPDD